jgi:hypothetical protein
VPGKGKPGGLAGQPGQKEQICCMSEVPAKRLGGKSKYHAIGTQRVGALNAIFAKRYGGQRENYVFPDDDAGREDLTILLHHYALNNPLAMPRIIGWRAPWMSKEETGELIRNHPKGERSALSRQQYRDED